jgi:Phage Connector (GP10).
MPKRVIRKNEYSALIDRKVIRDYYMEKYYNIYLNLYDFEGLDYQQKDYLLRKMWADGKIAIGKIKVGEDSIITGDYPNGQLFLCPFAATTLNIYDYPVMVSLVRTKDVKFIPLQPQKVDEDVVIGYAQRNKRSIWNLVSFIIEKICDVEMTLRTALKSQKMPWVIGYTPENQMQSKSISENLDQDEPSLFMEIEDVNNFKALVSGAPYICDKLYQLRESYENELREYFGVNNLGIAEKKEHLIGDEINVNNEQVQRSGECLYDSLNEMCERVQDVLGYPLKIKYNKPNMIKPEEADEEEPQEENEDDLDA